MINFPTQISDCDSSSSALLDLFLLTFVFVLQWFSLHWEILIMLLPQFQWTLSHSMRDVLFHCIACDYSHADWDRLCDHMSDVPWEDIFKLIASATASEFCEWVQFGIDVYIPRRKYQVKPHSFPWFSAACAAAIVHRNHFFRLYQREKSSDSKVKFRQASNRCKRVLEAAKLAYANKTKESITSQKLGSRDFWWIANSVLNKCKFSTPSPFSNPKVLPSASDKVLAFRTNLKLHNISVTSKMVQTPWLSCNSNVALVC